jgi:hypothetical protein
MKLPGRPFQGLLRLAVLLICRRAILSLALAFQPLASASAHHSFAMYDREKTLTVSGTIKEFSWTSPHVVIRLLTGDGHGDPPMDWFIEGSAPTVLARGGWTVNSLKPGDKVSLGIHPSKNGGLQGLLADEQEVLVNGQPAKGLQWLIPTPAE